MIIPYLDLTRDPQNKIIFKNIKRIIEKGTFILGQEVERFEKKFAKYIDASYCTTVASGTDALFLALRSLNIKHGDEVIVPAFSFIATVSPILHLGVKPVFVDVEDQIPRIDARKIEQAITKKTRAIIVVHIYGYACDMDEILPIAAKYGISVIEDAAQAHGTKYKNKMAGSFGDVSIFSFYPAKNLGAFGDGGAIVTKNKKIDKTVRMLRDHGQKEKYKHLLLGYNSRLDTIQAAVLLEKLKKLDLRNQKRREIAATYSSLLRNAPLDLPPALPNQLPNFHIYAIRTTKRKKLYEYLKEKSIYCNIHYPIPLHLQPALKSLGYKKGDFPNAEAIASTTLSLPMFPQLQGVEVKYVAKQIFEFFESK